MKKVSAIALTAFLVSGIALVGCRKKQDETAAIRSGVTEHLRALNTLNLSAMDIKVVKATVNGNQAEAQVEFVPKSGAPPGAGMQVSYSLEKRGEQWVVLKRNSVGGEIFHPATGANPNQPAPQGPTHGMPNFQELVQPSNPGAASGGTLPPGHPPVDSGKTPSQTGPPKKP